MQLGLNICGADHVSCPLPEDIVFLLSQAYLIVLSCLLVALAYTYWSYSK
jgi:hypothetical protein